MEGGVVPWPCDKPDARNRKPGARAGFQVDQLVVYSDAPIQRAYFVPFHCSGSKWDLMPSANVRSITCKHPENVGK